MIINMNTYQTSLAEFINERKQAMAKIAAGQPWLLLIATPIYVNTEKIDPLEDNFRKILTDPPAPVDKWSDGIHSGRPEPRLFGIEATFPRAHPDYEKALRLFRNGIWNIVSVFGAIMKSQHCQFLLAKMPSISFSS